MRFHAKVPLIALSGLVYVSITLFALGEVWRINDTGIHDRATTDPQAIFFQIHMTSRNSSSPRLGFSIKRRKLPMVASLGAGSLPRSMPIKLHITHES